MIAAGDTEHIYGIPYTQYCGRRTHTAYRGAGVQERELRVEAMAEKCSSETQELDYCTSSSDDSDIVDALDLHEMVLDEGEAEIILVSRKVRMISWCSTQFLKEQPINWLPL